MSERSPSTTRLAIVGIVVISLFASLLARLWYLQIVNDSEYAVRADDINLRVIHTEGTRGRILDRNGKVLVDNRVSNVVSLDRAKMGDLDDVGRAAMFDELAAELTRFGFPTKAPTIEELYQDKRYGPLELVPIATDVPPDLDLFLAEHSEEFAGVMVRRTSVRTYPYGRLAAHIVGYIGEINDRELDKKRGQGLVPDDTGRSEASRERKTYVGGNEIGKSGIEATQEAALRGVPAEQVIQVDARGEYVTTVKEAEPRPGDDVWLTIDIDLQAMAEQLLAERLAGTRAGTDNDGRALRAPQGSVVIIDPNNGEILAMASYPTFDPSQLVNGIDSVLWARLNDKAAGQPLFNWALQGTYAAASTFKLFTATAGLETGFLAPGNDSFVDRGAYKVPGCKGGKCEFQNAGRVRHGTVNVARSLTVSSDVFYYWIADQLWQGRDRFGEQPIQDVAGRYGLGDRTGVDLPGEATGRLPTPGLLAQLNAENPDAYPRGKWFTGDNLNTAIGQGDVLVTPLQLADAYATFANGGTRYRPQIVLKVTRPIDTGEAPADPSNFELVATVAPEALATVTFTGDHYQQILDGLVGVVGSGDGTARRPWLANRTAWPMAGKTGTAQVNGKADTSIFAGFGPAGAGLRPEYAISVIIPEAGFGSEVSAPLAFQILKPVSEGTVPETISDRDRALRDATAAKLAEAVAAAGPPPAPTPTPAPTPVPTIGAPG